MCAKNASLRVGPSKKVCPLCVAKTCAVCPVLAGLAGELWAADPGKCPSGHQFRGRV